MSEKSLLSLREIAGELNLNYRTMIDIKNQFENFLPNCFDGKNNRYTTDCIDFFRLIFALKDEGYTSEMVRKMLLKKLPLPDDAEIKEWISGYLEKYYSTWMDEDGCGWMETDADGGLRMEMDEDGQGRIEMEADGGRRTKMDGDEHGWMKMDQLKQEILTALPEMVTEQIQSISNQTEAALSDLTAQLNGAITQLYKVITELQLEYKDLHARLAHLEKELGAAPAPNPVLVELDLESMQVKLEKPEPVLQHATMDFVKASISDGKPDKLSVVQWIQAERERNPSVSYSELAEMLDEAGVPTLRGSVGWHRGTIRNLTIKP